MWDRLFPVADTYVYRSHAYVSMKSTLNQMSGDLIDFRKSPMGEADARLVAAARLVRPMSFDGMQMIRVGGPGDGGYVMVDDFEVSGAVSIGVGNDVSWDVGMAERGIPVAMFDHTVRRPPSTVPHGQFFRQGVGAVSGTRLHPLADLVTMAGYSEDQELILKIDVEGAEWEALAKIDSAYLSRFRQILIELHGLRGLAEAARGAGILTVLTALASNHAPVHVHANNYDDIVRFNDL
ncbi:hypothetical protein JZU54_01405, partial [bacterium]|nr:hypothetical protein [bacterium]